MNKIEKVFCLDRLLAESKYSVPLERILAELGCSEATFHRTKNFMITCLNAPIGFDSRTKGYYYNSPDGLPFRLPGFWLSKGEIEAFLCLDHAIEEIHEGYFHELLEPIRKRFEPLLKAQKTDLRTIRERIKIVSIASRQCDKTIFKAIASAVIGQKRLAIGHRTLAKNKSQQRIISPQTLLRYRDNWYVDAFCHLRNALRTFALDRIESAGSAPGKFMKVSREELDAFYKDAYGIFTGPAKMKAVIEFTGIAAREVSRETWHPKQEGRWLNDSTYRLTIPFGHSRELIMDVLRWGEETEVVEPKDLKDAIKTIISKMQKKYEEYSHSQEMRVRVSKL
jgi:predicted DNA-binding transcriptional regulator YafY